MEEASNSSRFKIWSAYLAFNVIIFISVCTIQVEDDSKAPRAWARGFTFLSLIVTIAAVAVHFHSAYRSFILNTKNELYMIATLLFLWTVLVSIVTSPTTGLAVEEDGAVALANLYYFTWAGFVTGVVLLASYIEQMFGISVTASFRNNESDIPNRNSNTMIDVKAPSMAFIFWSALMVSSIVVMGTAADIYNRNCEVDNDKPQPFCSRTVFAISSGVMSTILCLLVIVAKMLYYSIPFLGEVFLCAILFFLYASELIYATAADGPGGPLGNLYYFSWISFLLCFGIGKCLYEDYVNALEVAEIEFQDNRRTTVPSLERHDVDDEEALGSNDVGAVASMESAAVGHGHEEDDLEPKMVSLEESEAGKGRKNIVGDDDI